MLPYWLVQTLEVSPAVPLVICQASALCFTTLRIPTERITRNSDIGVSPYPPVFCLYNTHSSSGARST